MKRLNQLFAAAVIFSSFTLHAQTNPQIRVCNRTAGQFVVATSEHDQFGFCQYDSAIIGAIDLVTYQDNLDTIQSLQTYFDGIQACEPYGQTAILNVSATEQISVCVFADRSMIGSATLKAGSLAPENKKFNQALDILQ